MDEQARYHVYTSRMFRYGICYGGTIWSTTVQKLPTGPAIIVILSVIVLLSLIFAPNRGILWQYRKNKQSKQALLSETAKISPADLQQKYIEQRVDSLA